MSELIQTSINNLKEGMILGDDVISGNGLILIPRDTVIHQNHLVKLKLYNIYSVIIKEKITLDLEDEKVLPKEKEFHKFHNSYLEKENDVKDKLLKIGNGETIVVDDLLETTLPLLDSTKTKSSLFNYMYHLHSADDHTYSHSINVSLLCNVFANWLNLDNNQIEELTIAGLLHDIGKTKIDQKILSKPGKLTEEEFTIMKRHSRIGYNLIKEQNLSEGIKLGVLMHHERIDGSGYPQRLKGDDIHLYGKIIAITDIFDAMTSNRTYHKKFSPFKAIEVFERESYGLLDTSLLYVFLENIAHNYINRSVKLSDGQVGQIIFINSHHPSRPLISTDKGVIDLYTHHNLDIEEIL